MNKTVYIETYGCRMNIYDSEIIMSVLRNAGYNYIMRMDNADIIILNSCSVREDGHKKIYERLRLLEELKRRNPQKILIIAGCFTTFLNESLFVEYPFVNIIVHPECYRNLPSMINRAVAEEQQIYVATSGDDMYDDIVPVRYIENGVTAAIVVMKGCNQACSYCVETYTRGRERSRNATSVINEAIDATHNGFSEITLVGHIIDKYLWTDSTGKQVDFACLLDMVAKACPSTRIKFLSSHPAFLSNRIVDVIVANANVMRVIHLPLQSGSNCILQKMDRGYTIETFIERVKFIRQAVPDISIITDIIVGFCSESDDDFRQTVEVVSGLEFDDINVFKFSLREHTKAFEEYVDDVSDEIKSKRAAIIVELKHRIRELKYRNGIGAELQVIVEDNQLKDGKWFWCGRDNKHRTVVFDSALPIKNNDRIMVKIIDADNSALNGICVKINQIAG